MSKIRNSHLVLVWVVPCNFRTHKSIGMHLLAFLLSSQIHKSGKLGLILLWLKCSFCNTVHFTLTHRSPVSSPKGDDTEGENRTGDFASSSSRDDALVQYRLPEGTIRWGPSFRIVLFERRCWTCVTDLTGDHFEWALVLNLPTYFVPNWSIETAACSAPFFGL